MLDQRAVILRSIKGPAASILLALLSNPNRSLGNTELCTLTAYTDKSVTAGLRALDALGLVQRHARYRGWAPTTLTQQLVLPVDNSPDPVDSEPETLRLPPRSGSSIYPSPALPPPDEEATTTLPAQSEPETFRLPPRSSRLERDLVQHCAIAPPNAHRIALAGLQAGHSPEYQRYHALRWLAYATDGSRPQINNPPAFVASKLTANVPSPNWYNVPGRAPLAPHIETARSDWDQHADNAPAQPDYLRYRSFVQT